MSFQTHSIHIAIYPIPFTNLHIAETVLVEDPGRDPLDGVQPHVEDDGPDDGDHHVVGAADHRGREHALRAVPRDLQGHSKAERSGLLTC